MPLDNTTSGVQFLADASVALYIALERCFSVSAKRKQEEVYGHETWSNNKPGDKLLIPSP